MRKKESQRQEILAYLMKGKSITPMKALKKFGCFRLAAVIFVLKERGHVIKSEIVEERGKRFAKYTLFK